MEIWKIWTKSAIKQPPKCAIVYCFAFYVVFRPTSQDDLHDELISAEEIVSSSRMSQQDWDECSRLAHALFRFGQEVSYAALFFVMDNVAVCFMVFGVAVHNMFPPRWNQGSRG